MLIGRARGDRHRRLSNSLSFEPCPSIEKVLSQQGRVQGGDRGRNPRHRAPSKSFPFVTIKTCFMD